MRVLVVNAGSSSLKLSVLDQAFSVLGRDELALPDGRLDEIAVKAALIRLPEAEAVGHRVVHGGSVFSGPTPIDAEVETRIRALRALAPLHQDRALAGIAAVRAVCPSLPAVACFDTAFHFDLPAAAAAYALPPAWVNRHGLRRYGFHGLSHAHVARRVAEIVGGSDLRVISCHLGAGASLAAIRDGHSVDTTMGFTPLEGLVMATRSGSVDPGLLLWLMREHGFSAAELEDGLEHRSGLLGLSGTADMRVLLRRDDDEARTALAVYVHRLRAAIAAMAAAMDGVDVLAFTGGIGEHAAGVRAAAAAGLGFLGVTSDEALNAHAGPDTAFDAPQSAVRLFVIEAREDAEIARQVQAVLGGGGGNTEG
ncbi:MAG: acetate/propionate family kinase [Actinomycetota bacterium]|nr:acetate/propionate family kinase [Actinomycetota bacterium]